jgi:histidine triad (HIT) family protein
MSCVFYRIVGRQEPASIIYEDDLVMAFMGIKLIHPGECLVMPKEHLDHFTDIADTTAQHIIVIAQKIGRRVREVFKPQRVGMVVHGFGVPHAHLIVIPQQSEDDITSARFAYLEEGRIKFGLKNVACADRSVLDEHAKLLAIGPEA